MHRQLSLSPSPKHQHQHDDGVSGGDAAEVMALPEQSAEAKADKATGGRPGREERSIHLIPLLTFLCFLLLFIFSHHPTSADMSSFSGNRRLRML